MKSAGCKLYCLLLAVLILTSAGCAFDKMFLFPDKLQTEKPYSLIIKGNTKDTLQVTFSSDSSRVTFTSQGIPYPLPYIVESVFFSNKKGNRLNALFLKPESSKYSVTLLFLHGNAGSVISHLSIAHHLAARGFQVLLPDYSGFGLSSGKATRKNVLIDATAAISYLNTREDTRTTPIVIYGQSLGGHLAPVAAQINSDKVSAVVVEGAFSSHDDIAAHSTGLGIIARLCVKEEYSAVKAIRKWHKPLLVIHSREDSIIPFFMGQKIFDNAHEPKVFYAIDKPHIAGPVYYPDSIVYKIKQLLK